MLVCSERLGVHAPRQLAQHAVSLRRVVDCFHPSHCGKFRSTVHTVRPTHIHNNDRATSATRNALELNRAHPIQNFILESDLKCNRRPRPEPRGRQRHSQTLQLWQNRTPHTTWYRAIAKVNARSDGKQCTAACRGRAIPIRQPHSRNSPALHSYNAQSSSGSDRIVPVSPQCGQTQGRGDGYPAKPVQHTHAHARVHMRQTCATCNMARSGYRTSTSRKSYPGTAQAQTYTRQSAQLHPALGQAATHCLHPAMHVSRTCICSKLACTCLSCSAHSAVLWSTQYTTACARHPPPTRSALLLLLGMP